MELLCQYHVSLQCILLFSISYLNKVMQVAFLKIVFR